MGVNEAKTAILENRTALGIEFGSTRIKAVLVDDKNQPIASGAYEWENQYVDGIWTYSLEEIWKGLQGSYQDMAEDVQKKYGMELTSVGAFGVSAMMHGYMPVLPVVAFYVLRKKNMDEKGGEIARKKQILICALCSLAVGCYDGFYGPGTGTFLLLLYTGLGKMSVAKASGTMKVTNLSSNVAALVVFLLSGKIVIMLGIAASVFSIAGHYTGAGMVMKNGSRIIRPIILIVLALLFIKIISGV